MSQPAETPLETGARLLQQGDAEGAIQQLMALVEVNPHDMQALGYLGVAFARKGDYAASIATLQRASRIAPEDSTVSHNLAVAYFHAGQPAEARVAAERALVLNPVHAGARQLLERLGATPAAADPTWSSSATVVADPAPLAALPFDVTPATFPASELSQAATSSGGLLMDASTAPVAQAPGIGARLLRGWGWGLVYGQYWTAWNLFWTLVWQGSKLGVEGMAITSVIMALFFAFCGSTLGLLMAITNAREGTAMIMTLAVGLGLFILELTVLGGSPINFFFWFFTSRFVGTGIFNKVQEPVVK